ncbi:indole-3-acetaldehyde oxidase-like isoform X1 [Ananas comosus]|uniref:Indole-3-acetaldehyde oxidase-like isoform X1 n=2 Tax=Ananas comosus TaxID=4615 RepID=A0A6P5FRV1_ANACO|nr:indole-3-acetaldehyde oxidase-like isoform X1 [Ananas comosus]
MMGKLVFAVNGERREVSEAEVPEPSITLLEFLRTRTRFKGAKLGCGEGGCGACAVLLSTYDPVTDQVNDFTVSSCLTLLCSINLCSITTTEGLGNSKDGFHSIHRRLSGFHASQCGFCTPGMCMSLLSSLVNADKTNQPDPPEGFSKLLVSEAEKAVLGNLCRCTGYRPILDTCKSFAADVDLEDLGLNSFWKRGGKNANADKLPYYKRGGICTFPEFLKSEVKSFSAYSNVAEISSFGGGYWCRPKSIKELYKLLDSEEFSKSHVKMVVGNTASGVYKELDLFDKYIDLREIPELTMIKNNHEGLEIGAAVSISRTVEALREENQSLVFSKIADHMEKVASQFVRNTASMGGNLVMAQRNHFPSDIATILLAADSTVCLQLSSERLSLTLEEFLEMPPCDHKTLLVSIYIPSWISRTDLLFETYRAAPRPLGNALAYLNSAFLAETSLDKESGDVVIENLRLAFGAYGCPHAIRARKVEKFLLGKAIRSSVLLEGIRLLRETIIPEQGTPHAAYRISLAVAFLFSFLHPVTAGLEKPMKNNRNVLENVSVSAECPNGSLNGHANITLDSASEHGNHCNRMLSSSEQIMELNKEYHPVGEPTKKAGAEIQASGEAVYVDDIPSPNDCLYGAFVYSTRPFAHVKSIEFHSSLAQQKIIKIVSVDDIPKGGSNIGASSMFGSDPLFADSLTEYAGQPLSVVIAETQRFANLAAKHAVVAYSTENLEPPILSVEDAVKRSSYFEVPSFVYPKEVGDYSKGMAEADHTILSAKVTLGSQYYFYMETQTALAIPDEDNCMVVYSSSQCPETAQGVIAKCLGIPFHNVRVITRRVGGGFGGKALRSLPVATACALAAYKLRRPVRMYLDRKTDMIMVGGRHPMKVYYSVGFKSDGKITALHIDLLINAGRTKDVSPIMPHNIIEALKKYNWGSLSFDVKVCKTNTPTRSAMRAPGEVQGSYIAEAVIEHVASALGVEPNSIRQKNLHTFESLKLFYEGCEDEALEYTLPTIFDKLAFSSSYRHRVEMIKRFNSSNQWKKRGISCVPIVHKVILRPTPGKVSVLNDGSIVVEVGGIELGQGLWTKVKQMAAFALGKLLGEQNQSLLERIRVVQADTLSLIQGGWTAGSTTSESSCEAVRVSCNVLVERLKSLKERLEIQQGTVSWDSLIMQANLESVNLSATAYWVPDGSSASYLNFGAAVSEVEVDLLTGTTTILRSDLTYDCGQSLNPAVDLGQVEGAFVQGIGFFMYEEYLSNSDGLVVSDGTWTYKVPTVDTIPKQFNVELINSGYHKRRVLSSKASGEPPLLLAASVHCATREAIRAARAQLLSLIGSEESPLAFDLAVPATMPVVKELCGLKNVDKYLAYACKLANT